MSSLFQSGVLYRLPLYMIYGLVCEVLFTAVTDLISPHFLKSWNVFGNNSPQPPLRTCPEYVSGLRGGVKWKAIGYSFLWMLPIYALLVFIEPASEGMKNFPLLVRGLLYVLALWMVEYFSGRLIKKISGHIPWDYSASRWNLSGAIRFDFLPIWLVFVLVAEWLSHKFILLTPALIEVFRFPLLM